MRSLDQCPAGSCQLCRLLCHQVSLWPPWQEQAQAEQLQQHFDIGMALPAMHEEKASRTVDQPCACSSCCTCKDTSESLALHSGTMDWELAKQMHTDWNALHCSVTPHWSSIASNLQLNHINLGDTEMLAYRLAVARFVHWTPLPANFSDPVKRLLAHQQAQLLAAPGSAVICAEYRHVKMGDCRASRITLFHVMMSRRNVQCL